MDEAETDLWVDLCEVAFDIAKKTKLRPSTVMEEICGRITKHSYVRPVILTCPY